MAMEGRIDDYYGILGLDTEATRAQIKAAYRELAKTHHPDKKNLNKKTFGEIQADLDGRRMSEAADFRLVQAAWETLSDTEKRKEYDGELTFFRQEQAKTEKRLAKQRAKQQRKDEQDDRRKRREQKREADIAAKEAELTRMAEIKAEEEFLEKLYTDFGQEGRVAFELRNLRELIRKSDPELRISNPELITENRVSITNDPELEDITNKTPSRMSVTPMKRERRNAETFNDPELEAIPRASPSTESLMAEIDRAMKMRLSQPRLSGSVQPFQAFLDPEIN